MTKPDIDTILDGRIDKEHFPAVQQSKSPSTILESTNESISAINVITDVERDKDTCCSEIPSFLWFLKSSWPENIVIPEESFNRLLPEKDEAIVDSSLSLIQIPSNPLQNDSNFISTVSTQDPSFTLSIVDIPHVPDNLDISARSSPRPSFSNLTFDHTASSQSHNIESGNSSITTIPVTQSIESLTNSYQTPNKDLPHQEPLDSPGSDISSSLSPITAPKDSLIVTPSFTNRNKSFLISRRSSFDVKDTLIYSNTMFQYIPDLNISEEESSRIISNAVGKNQGSLVGWQVEITDPLNQHNGIYVIAGVKRNRILGGPTLFLILSSDDHTPEGTTNWDRSETYIPLKRAPNKAGYSFKVLRRIAKLNQHIAGLSDD